MQWRDGHFRLFLSHLAEHKKQVGEVAVALLEYGIEGWVAHTSIAVSAQWQDEILEGLKTCEGMALFLHHGFRESDWTDQETGFAIAREIMIVPLRMEDDADEERRLNPYGFVGIFQAAPCFDEPPERIADMIAKALFDDDRTRPSMEIALLSVLSNSRSFKASNRRIERIDGIIDDWTPEKLYLLERAVEENNQVSEATGTMMIIDRIFEENDV